MEIDLNKITADGGLTLQTYTFVCMRTFTTAIMIMCHYFDSVFRKNVIQLYVWHIVHVDTCVEREVDRE